MASGDDTTGISVATGAPAPDAWAEDKTPKSKVSTHSTDSVQEEQGCLARCCSTLTNWFRGKYTAAKEYEDNDEVSSGCFRRLARSNTFINTTLFVIFLNACWIGVDTEFNDADILNNAHPTFIVGELFFCTYFTIELIVRFFAFRKKKHCGLDGWFVFDTFLVTCMIAETVVMPLIVLLSDDVQDGGPMKNAGMLRMLRLLRLTRMTRIMRSFPAMMILIKSMVMAMRAVFWTITLQLMFMYVFAIVFCSQLKDSPNPTIKGHFEGLGATALTLLSYGILCDELSSFLQDMVDYNFWWFLLFVLYIVLSAITILNMLLGILCTVVTDSAKSEKQIKTLESARGCLVRAFEILDTSGDGFISKDEFDVLVEHKEAQQALRDLEINPSHLVQLSNSLFSFNPHVRSVSNAIPHSVSNLHMLQFLPGEIADDAEVPKPLSSEASQDSLQIEGDCSPGDRRGKVKLNFQDFVESVIALRPSTVASVLDMQSLKKQYVFDALEVQGRMANFEERLVACVNGISDAVGSTGTAKAKEGQPRNLPSAVVEESVERAQLARSGDRQSIEIVEPSEIPIQRDRASRASIESVEPPPLSVILQDVPSDALFYVVRQRLSGLEHECSALDGVLS